MSDGSVQELEQLGAFYLGRRVEDAQTTDEEAVREQLQHLHLRLFAEDLSTDDEPIDQSFGLWSAALDHSGDPVRAWKTTLTAMLQDLRIIFY